MHPHTGVSTHSPSCSSRREQNDGITKQLDVGSQCCLFLCGECRFGGVKAQSVFALVKFKMPSSAPVLNYFLNCLRSIGNPSLPDMIAILIGRGGMKVRDQSLRCYRPGIGLFCMEAKDSSGQRACGRSSTAIHSTSY